MTTDGDAVEDDSPRKVEEEEEEEEKEKEKEKEEEEEEGLFVDSTS